MNVGCNDFDHIAISEICDAIDSFKSDRIWDQHCLVMEVFQIVLRDGAFARHLAVLFSDVYNLKIGAEQFCSMMPVVFISKVSTCSFHKIFA